MITTLKAILATATLGLALATPAALAGDAAPARCCQPKPACCKQDAKCCTDGAACCKPAKASCCATPAPACCK